MNVNLPVILFGLLAVLAIASALITVISKHPVRSAMALVVHFFMLAGLYLTMNAQFIAAVQVLVYAGAIMVLVIFVIMLLNLGNEKTFLMKFQTRQAVAVFFASAFIILMASLFISHSGGLAELPADSMETSTAQNLGNELFTNYIFPFEAISILLLAAIVGAIVLAKRKLS